MNQFKCYIEKQIGKSIRALVGKGMQYSYLSKGNRINLESPNVICSKIALRISDLEEFIVISSDWVGDTEKEAIDCHKFSINYVHKPDFLEIESTEKNNKLLNGIQSPEHLSFFHKRNEITKIEIFNYSKKINQEQVEYDMAIVFHCDKQKVIIRSNPSIAGGLLITLDENEYKDLRDECEIRLEL